MTSKSGFFVFILIASGCLSKACGDGEISTSPRSFEAAPTPDQSNVARPAGPLGDPYVYATLADVGVTIGPGVIAPYPTEAYTGPCEIDSTGTEGNPQIIENKIITCPTLKFNGHNITIRNCEINLTDQSEGGNGIRMGQDDRTFNGFTLEYSYLNYPNQLGKVINAFGGPFRDFVIRYNHIEGGEDTFFMEGDLDGMIVEYNVIGPLACQDHPTAHVDGFQLGNPAYPTSGYAIVRGNKILTDLGSQGCGKTVFFWNATGTMTSLIESNNLPVYGNNTIWNDEGFMDVRYNTYTPEFEAAIGNRCNSGPLGACSGVPRDDCCFWPSAAAKWDPEATGGVAECNRYESDGRFVEDVWFQGRTHKITGCPDYP